ncbi:MAG TPA: hypothetical protein DDY20_06785 [Desulfobulbaceae bacterium]|nr:hypothetical protein [Desulfobulbaceae bacterium]
MKSALHHCSFRTSVTPAGTFAVALHQPSFRVANLREQDAVVPLGHTAEGVPCDNRVNFPAGGIRIEAAKPIYEIANAFPFRGTTFIDTGWADARARNPAAIGLPPPPACSLRRALAKLPAGTSFPSLLPALPIPLLYSLAANSTDPEELAAMAEFCCRLERDGEGRPTGLRFLRDDRGRLQAAIDDFELFETIANNPALPDLYKEVMVLRPGVQGDSAIVGEWAGPSSHVLEYLRANSYIAGGHYAANMASDAIRYRAADLSPEDMRGLRHLYYQRVYVTLAEKLGIDVPERRTIRPDQLEALRLRILNHPEMAAEHGATLWGWNYGYDFSASGYRLHASHQMIHQQYAMVPESAPGVYGTTLLPAFSCGDLVADTIARYRELHQSDFFRDFLAAIRANVRTDGGAGPHHLVVLEDDNVLLFVPKAQVSQWELQLMVVADTDGGPVGNVLEADLRVRAAIDRTILAAQKIYAGLGATMVTSIELPKRFGLMNGQRLLYSFLPKLPWSMGAFSEAQLRFICGYYPEDFAEACRRQINPNPHNES